MEAVMEIEASGFIPKIFFEAYDMTVSSSSEDSGIESVGSPAT